MLFEGAVKDVAEGVGVCVGVAVFEGRDSAVGRISFPLRLCEKKFKGGKIVIRIPR